jgi:putative ABC transport system permease protein
MTLLQFTVKNLVRRPLRTLLTVAGIGLGIGAVVALVGLAKGLTKSWEDALNARGTDLIVCMGRGLQTQPFDDKLIQSLKGEPGVGEMANLLVETTSVEEGGLTVISGREFGSYLWQPLQLLQGRMLRSADEKGVVLGKLAAESLEKKIGDTVFIETDEFPVVGIVDGKAIVENGSIFMNLPQLQALMGKEGKVNFINMKLAEGSDVKEVAQRLKGKLKDFRVETTAEVAENNDLVKALQAMNWGTSLVALLVGTFGVMNTMFMSVFERTKELGILIALGWRRSRILKMILCESVVLCAAAGVLGVILGIALVKVLAATPWMSGKLEPYTGWDLAAFAFGLSLLVGLLSGLYPAFHCTRINPSAALRQ